MADLNIDFMGNRRGKCKDQNCDCTLYIKSDGNACSMCGCFPGKHELIVIDTTANIPKDVPKEVVSPSKLNAAIENAIDQITPSKMVEVDLDTGAVAIVARQIQFDNGATSGAKKSAIHAGSPMEIEEEADDPDDPDFVPDKGNSSMEAEDQIEKEPVTTSRNVDGSVADFSAAAIKTEFLSVDLKKKILEHGVLKNETAFMIEAGSYLLALSKKEKPNQQELTIFSSAMVDMFPELKSAVGKCAWLIYDFFSFKELEEEAFEANVADFLRRLAKLAVDEDEEKGYAHSLVFMAKKLMYKQPKSVHSIVTVIEPLGSLAPLEPVDKEAPRLVLSIRGEKLAQCFLLFDGVRMELQKPAVSQAVTLLLAAYYLFDIRYPDPFIGFLTVLEIECLKKPITIKASQRTLFKFVRDLQKV